MYLFILYSILALSVIVTSHSKEKLCLHDFDKPSSISLKGILAVCVVVRHLLGKSFHISGLIPLGYYSVILFFFCTGYGLMLQLQKRRDSYLNHFFSERCLKVFLPLALATIAFVLFRIVVLDERTKIVGSLWTDLLNGNTILPFSWFAIAILLFYVAFYICAIIFKHNFHVIPFFLLLFTAIYLCIIGIILGWGGYWINAVLAFNVGTFFCLYEIKLKLFISSFPRHFSFVNLLLLFSLIAMTGRGFWIESFTCCFCVPLMTVFSIYYLGMFNNLVTENLGKYSYEVYLTHGVVLALLPVWGNSLGSYCYYTLICVVLIILLSVLLKIGSSYVYKLIVGK